MNPDIFISDFERTENSDELHAILGRALIVATRFDSMCEAAAFGLRIKKDAVLSAYISEEEYDHYLIRLISKYRDLNGSICSLGLPDDISVVLHDARKARNMVVHHLSKGFEGCLDEKIDDLAFVELVSELVMDIVCGDIVISYIISLSNGEPCPNTQFVSSYKDKVIQWVVKR